MLKRDQVLHIAKLANLTLTEEEILKFQKQLSDILDYVELLDEVDTQNVKPTSHPIRELKNVFGDSLEVANPLTNEQALFNAKHAKNGYIVTDAVL